VRIFQATRNEGSDLRVSALAVPLNRERGSDPGEAATAHFAARHVHLPHPAVTSRPQSSLVGRVASVHIRIRRSDEANTMGPTSETKSMKIPPICQFWRTLAGSLPTKWTIGGLDVSMTVASAFFLTAARFMAEWMLVNAFGWPFNSIATKNAAASCGSMVHSTLLVLGLIGCFRSNKYNPTERLTDAPQWWQETVTALLQFCTGYMFYDGILNIIWLKSQMQEGGIDAEDLMFLGHHVATVFYMTSIRITGAGHQSAMICMLLGELSNPLQHTRFILEIAQTLDCCNGELSQMAFEVARVSFALVYCSLRAGLGPFFCAHVTLKLLRDGKRNGIPVSIVVVYVSLIWAIMWGSIPWITNCYSTLEEYGFPKLTSTSNFDASKSEL